MSYSITVEDISEKFWPDDGECWDNLTWGTILQDDEALCELYEDAGYHEGHDEYQALDSQAEKAEHIRELFPGVIDELADGFYPVMNYVHVLQSRPSDEDILKIHKHASTMVIIQDCMLDNYFIGLSGGGMDLSDQIAYAYMVIDRDVPKCFRDAEHLSLTEEGSKELAEFLQKQD